MWTPATLDAYLADPERFLPGTGMGTPALREAVDRRDVIDYLEESGPTDRKSVV